MSTARPWLRSLRRRAAARRRGDDHAPLPRRHLLVGVEGEGGEVAAGADRAALGVDRAERLAGILEDAEAVLGGERLQLRHRRRVAEDVDRQDACGALADRRRGRRGVDVQRDRVDVAEDRPRALVEQAVGGGDEAERAGQDLVAGAPAEPRTPRCSARCRWRPRPRPRPRASARTRARSARPSAPARAGRSAAPPAPAPPRAAPISGAPAGSASTRPRTLERVLERVDQRLPGGLDDVLRDADRAPVAARRRRSRAGPG